MEFGITKVYLRQRENFWKPKSVAVISSKG